MKQEILNILTPPRNAKDGFQSSWRYCYNDEEAQYMAAKLEELFKNFASRSGKQNNQLSRFV